MYKNLKDAAWRANMDFHKYDLIIFTWGNLSGTDRDKHFLRKHGANAYYGQ